MIKKESKMMITNKDITVIIPVHEWNENVEQLLNEAVKSVPSDINLIISTVEGTDVHLSKEASSRLENCEVVTTQGASLFQSLVNNGVKNVKTDWFSILEFDDEYSPIWFNNFIKYQEYNQQYNFFLPINDLYNVEGGKDEFIGNGNEAAWASAFSEQMGVIDAKSLEDFFDFYLTGGIFNTKTWNDLGGLKESIKVTFWYEFMLRAAHKGENFYVVPKVGYAHVLGRDNSLLMQYRATVDVKESEFWFKTAKKESFFKEDRNKTYCPDDCSEKEE